MDIVGIPEAYVGLLFLSPTHQLSEVSRLSSCVVKTSSVTGGGNMMYMYVLCSLSGVTAPQW